MIAHTIEAALKSEVFDKVMVSTDSQEIADIAIQFGAEVPFLRKDHADDYSTVSDVVVSTLKRLELEEGEKFEYVGMLMPNCPIRNETDIQRLYSEFVNKNREFQISAFKYGWMNPWWAHQVEEDGKAIPFFKADKNVRSQDMDKLYCPTGAYWMATTQALLSSKTFYGKEFCFSMINWKAAVDIDDLEDLQMARAIYTMINNQSE